MSCIHYKFKSSLDYSTLTFDGLHLTLGELKRLISVKQKLAKSQDFDLQITNAQTSEVYKNDDELIPKNASVIVSRAPVCMSTKALGTAIETPVIEATAPSSKQMDKRLTYEQLSQTSDLANANASEEDKIRAMMSQSTREYDKSNYVKSKYPTGQPHQGYVCHRCGQSGHFIATCPLRGSDYELPKIKRSTGIPQSFMQTVDPKAPGAMMTADGNFVVPKIDAEAYRIGKKEKPPFVDQQKPQAAIEERFIPGELLCSLCKDILKEAVVIRCCGNSYCDECIREKLLESENHTCPQCNESDISPDSLISNAYLRKLVMNFENETGYIKPRRRSSGNSSTQSNSHGTASSAHAPSQMHHQSPLANLYPPPPTKASTKGGTESSQPKLAIPTHLIGLPPHVINAHMRDLEKKQAMARSQPIQSASVPQVQQQSSRPVTSPNSYPQASHASQYSSHSYAHSHTGVSNGIQPNTPTMDEPKPSFGQVGSHMTMASHMSPSAQSSIQQPYPPGTSQPQPVMSTMSMPPSSINKASVSQSGLRKPPTVEEIKEASLILAQVASTMLATPGQVPPHLRPALMAAAAQAPIPNIPGMPPLGHPGPMNVPQQHGNIPPFGPPTRWPTGQPPGPGFPPSYIPPSNMPPVGPGGPRHPPPAHPGVRPGFRPPGPPMPGPGVGPRFSGPMLSKEEFYREKERLLRDKEEKEKRRRLEEERERQERLRIEREKKRELELNKMTQDFIDAKRPVKTESAKSLVTRSRSRSRPRISPRSRSKSPFKGSRSRSKTPLGKLPLRSRSRSPRFRPSRSPRSRTSRSHTPGARPPRPARMKYSRSPRPRSHSPRSRSPRSRSPRSFTPPPRKRSVSRSWSRTPPPRSAYHRKSLSRSPARGYLRKRSRSPDRRYDPYAEREAANRKRGYSPGRVHGYSPSKDRGRYQVSPGRYNDKHSDYYRNPEQYDPRWAEYLRNYYKWYEMYGKQYGYPPVPDAMPSKDRSPPSHYDRDHRRPSKSPTRSYYKESDLKSRDRYARESTHNPRDVTKKRKYKSPKDEQGYERELETDERMKKPKHKKKKLDQDKEDGRYSNHPSQEKETPPAEKENAKASEKKSCSKEAPPAEKHSRSRSKSKALDDAKLETSPNSSDLEQIKTLNMNRGNVQLSHPPHYGHLICINTASFEDTIAEKAKNADKENGETEKIPVESENKNGKLSPKLAKDENVKVILESNGNDKEEIRPKIESTQKTSESPPREKVDDMDVDNEVKNESTKEPDAVADVNDLKSLKTEVKKEHREKSKKSKDKEKSKAKKLKEREKLEKLEKIERLQAEIRRLEKQKEEGLMVLPPELSRWEKEDTSGHDSDNKEVSRTRISSSISKPSLPKHVLESAEKAITQKPRGVMSIASAVSTVSSKPTSGGGSSSRRIDSHDRARERSPPRRSSSDSHDFRDSRDSSGRRVVSDMKNVQVTISSHTKDRHSHRDLEIKSVPSRRERDDRDQKRSEEKKVEQPIKDKPQKIRLHRNSSKDMLPPRSTKPISDSKDDKDRKLSVMDEAAFEPDYEEEVTDEVTTSSNTADSGSSPMKKPCERSSSQRSRSGSPTSTPDTSDRDKKPKHKKKKSKHKHKSKKHKKQKKDNE